MIWKRPGRRRKLLGKLCLRLVINCNLAPVADLYNDSSRVLFERCFGTDPGMVSDHVKVYIGGLQSCGLAACVKHFPGHGTVVGDSHKLLPISRIKRSELNYHLRPFAAAINAGVKIMMAAHLRFPEIDSRSSALFPAFFKRYCPS